MIIIPANTLSAGGYEVANSCRFNYGSNQFFEKVMGTPTSTKIGTFSCWVKLGNITTEQTMLGAYADSNNRHHIEFQADHNIEIFGKASGSTNMSLITNAYYRDVSAWYNIVVAYDTSQGTASNRVKLYVNGTQVTSFATETYPNQDTVLQFNTDGSTHTVGRNKGGNYADGYMCEVVFIDNQQLTPTSFGEFDSDTNIWKPIDVSSLTGGNIGFYLDFEDGSNLGNDVFGGTDFDETNITSANQTTDTCTNNFATLNPLGFGGTTPTFSQGNLNASTGSGASLYSVPTIGVSSGKWYVEGKLVTGTVDGGITYSDYGFADRSDSAGQSLYTSSARVFWLSAWDSKINYRTGGSTTAGLQTGKTGLSQGDFFQLYLDMDNELMYWGRNGSVTNSTGISFNGKESLTGEYFFAFGDQFTSGTYKYSTNFGQGSIDGTAVSNYNDANGYGSFKYNPTVTTDEGSKDFLALNTKNLAEYG